LPTIREKERDQMEEIIYFELNNWWPGSNYPDEEPFLTWLSDDLAIYFEDEKWVKENKLCVGVDFVDMSLNFCIIAKKEWIQDNCPKLLTEYKKFLREPDEDGCVYGHFGHKFLEYKEDNIGIHEDFCISEDY